MKFSLVISEIKLSKSRPKRNGFNMLRKNATIDFSALTVLADHDILYIAYGRPKMDTNNLSTYHYMIWGFA